MRILHTGSMTVVAAFMVLKEFYNELLSPLTIVGRMKLVELFSATSAIVFGFTTVFPEPRSVQQIASSLLSGWV